MKRSYSAVYQPQDGMYSSASRYPPKKKARTSTKSNIRTIVKQEISKAADKKISLVSSPSTGTLVNASGTLVNMTGLIRGTGSVNSFSGDSIQALSFQMRYGWQIADSYNYCRVILFQWNSASAPSVDAILDTTGSLLDTGAAPFAEKQWDERKSFKIFYDRVHLLDASHPESFEKVYVRLPSAKPTQFLYGSDVVQSGGIYLILLTDSTATSHPSIKYAAQLVYTDV